MSMGSGVTPLLITVSEAKDVPFRADPFVVLEAGGARTQTDVLRDTTAPVWDQMFTLRADFSAGTREELKVMAWHEDVYEDQYTQMIWPEQLRRFEQQVQGDFVGVGILIRHDDKRELMVQNPLEGRESLP